jgi:hypothetical protein
MALTARRSLLSTGLPQPCAQAATFLARTSSLTRRETSAYIKLINGLVANGLWSQLDLLYVLATNNTANAALNLISTSYSLVPHGSATFIPDMGYAGDGSTGYIDTNWTPSTNAVNYTNANGSFGIYIQTSRAVNSSAPVGSGSSGATFTIIQPYETGSLVQYDINDAVFPTVASPSSQGAWLVSRVSGTVSVYRNGSSTALGSHVSSPVSLPTQPVTILAFNNSGVRQSWSTDQISAVFFGAGLSGAQAATMNNLLNAFMVALGHGVY